MRNVIAMAAALALMAVLPHLTLAQDASRDFIRTELDAISTDHPIFVWYNNGHDACVNSKALEIAGILEQRHGLRGKRHPPR